MSDLKPLGSERLQGDEKIKRILEIARYKEVPKQVVNELSSVEYSKTLSDGVKYVIAKEKLGYIIKKSINEGVEEYIEPMKNRKYYNSYSQALKRLNLLAREVNYVQGVNEGIDLFNEQKRYTLKTPKPAPSETTYDEPTPDMSMDSGIGAEADLGMGSETSAGGELDLGLDMDMGAEQPTDMGMDLGSEDTEMKPTDEGDVDFKTIQKITGKLSQKLRELDSTQGLDSSNMKYVINSILSAMNLEKFNEDDKDEVIERLEGEIDYGLEDTGVDIEATGEESSSEFDVESPEGGEELKEYDVYGNEGFGYFDKDENPVDIDDVDFDFEPEGHVQSYDEFISKFDRRDHNDPHYDIKKRQHDSNIEKYGNLRLGKKRTPVSDVSSIDRIMDSIFAESKVEKTINKYLSESVIKETEEKIKTKKTKMVESIGKMATTYEQELTSKKIIKEFKDVELVGRTNKKNIIFNIAGEEFKVNQKGFLE